MYDRVNKWGGAERVLLALHTIFPYAPLFTSVYHPKKARWATVFRIKTSFLQHIPFAKSYHQLFASLMPYAFRSFNFTKYDIVISVTSESAKNIRVGGKTLHICLCLTPTRYLWSGYDEYFSNKIFRFFTFPIVGLLRWGDQRAAKKPHAFIAISKEVQRRIKKYYGRESEVIYPPLTLQVKSEKLVKSKKKEYFLVVSRLSRFTPYKKIDIAVAAATRLQLPLIVVGEGNQAHFKKFAGPTVQFVGKVTDEELVSYYENAKALIFPGKEDFGLVMVEAQAAGIPVIAYKAGGAAEIVKEGKTGEFFTRQTVNSLVNVLKKFNARRYNSKSCKENAKRFSFSYFEKALKQYILKVI